MNNEILDKIFNDIKNKTNKESILFEIVNGKATAFNCKIGGDVYLPKNYEYPMGEDGHPLMFLGQINFNEIPRLKYLPDSGILQFFISNSEEKLWGLRNSKEIKVVYHNNIEYSLNNIRKINVEEKADNFPIEGECLLKGRINYSRINYNDFRFNDIFMNSYRKYINTNAENYWEVEEVSEDIINEIFSAKDINILGHANFIQDDIRLCNEYSNYDEVLFGIPSIGNDNINICWGDNGIANFLINKKDLINLDFSNVLFTWDCY